MRDRRSQKEARRAAVNGDESEEDHCHPRKIFVGGLAHKTSTQHLRDYFGKHGSIVDAVVLRWPDGRSRGFGYVTFCDVSSAAAAMLETHQVGGRKVDVKRAVPGTNKLFVGGLPQSATATELREHFEACGTVSDAVVMIDPVTGRSRGFGFVCFLPGQEGAAAVTAALEQYQTHRLRGKWIEVKNAAPPHKLAVKEAEGAEDLGDMGVDVAAAEVPATEGLKKEIPTAFPKDFRPDVLKVASPNRRSVVKGTSKPPTVSVSLEPQKVSLPSALPRRLADKDKLSLDAALSQGPWPASLAATPMPFGVMPGLFPFYDPLRHFAPGLVPPYEATHFTSEGLRENSDFSRTESRFDISEGLQRSLAAFIRLQTEAATMALLLDMHK